MLLALVSLLLLQCCDRKRIVADDSSSGTIHVAVVLLSVMMIANNDKTDYVSAFSVLLGIILYDALDDESTCTSLY